VWNECLRMFKNNNDFNTINELRDKLSNELWQNVSENDNNDVDRIFNSFLNTYLQIFYSCFPKMTVNKTTSKKQWITKGIINPANVRRNYTC